MAASQQSYLGLKRRASRIVQGMVRPILRRYRDVLRTEFDHSLEESRGEISRIHNRLDGLAALINERLDSQDDRLTLMRQQLRYLSLAAMAARLPADLGLTRYELSFSSQNGEDGVLLEIFQLIGTVNRVFVEIGAHADESNCLFLADVLGWHGVIIEADPYYEQTLRRKYQASGTMNVIGALADRENLDALLSGAGVPNDVDLLSIDIDGNDYWLWESMRTCRPRVVVIEYNSSLGADRSLVETYDAERVWNGTTHFGASARALTDLGKAKGYRVVYADITSCNLFFVREDVAPPELPAMSRVRRPTNYYLEGRRHPNPPPGSEWLDLDTGQLIKTSDTPRVPNEPPDPRRNPHPRRTL